MKSGYITFCFFLSVFFFSVYGQCTVDEYLLHVFRKDKKAIEKIYSDSTHTSYYQHSDRPQTLYGNQKPGHIDAYTFKLKKYACIDSCRDNYCEVYYQHNKLSFVRINIYFALQDSLLCQSVFKEIITKSKVADTFPFCSVGTSTKLFEISNGSEIALQSPIVTPFYQFYKTEKKQESLSVVYSLQNANQEYELTITFLNLKNIE